MEKVNTNHVKYFTIDYTIFFHILEYLSFHNNFIQVL